MFKGVIDQSWLMIFPLTKHILCTCLNRLVENKVCNTLRAILSIASCQIRQCSTHWIVVEKIVTSCLHEAT